MSKREMIIDELSELQKEIETLKDENARLLEINQGLKIENTELHYLKDLNNDHDKMVNNLEITEKNLKGKLQRAWLDGFNFGAATIGGASDEEKEKLFEDFFEIEIQIPDLTHLPEDDSDPFWTEYDKSMHEAKVYDNKNS